MSSKKLQLCTGIYKQDCSSAISQEKSALKNFLCMIQTGKTDLSFLGSCETFLALRLKKLHHNLCLLCYANANAASTTGCGISKEGQNKVKLCKGEVISGSPGVRAVLQGTVLAEQSRKHSKALGKWVHPPMSHKVSKELVHQPCATAWGQPQG